METTETLVPFVDATPILHNPAELQGRMARDGFFFVKGLFPREAVLDLRRQILTICDKYGWLNRAEPLMDAKINVAAASAMEPFCGVGVTQEAYADVYKLEAFHRLAQHPAIM